MTRHARTARLAAIGSLFAGLVMAGAAFAARPYVDIEKKLTPGQMRATGLDQLDPQQLSLLNQLLRDEHTAVADESVAAERDRKHRAAEEPVASRLKGEFRGWSNGTIFALENGQRWRVLDGDFHATQRLANPAVTIKPGLFGSWYMQVEGVSVNAKVKRADP